MTPPINYEALAGTTTTAGGTVPPDGTHTARLERASLTETDRGSRLITEWSAGGFWWDSWNRFDTTGMRYTQQLLDGLGVDRSRLTDDEQFTDALVAVEGRTYTVRTESRRGREGDRWFTSTYIVRPTEPDPGQLTIEDKAKAPPPAVPAGSAIFDDDIPF